METIIIILIFLTALGFLGNRIFQSFNLKNKKGCAKGCGSCAASVDFEKIAADMGTQSLSSSKENI